MKWATTLVLTISAITTGIEGSAHTHTDSRTLVRAIHLVETGGRTGPIMGDNGAAMGPLQIHRACWIDANLSGKYEDVADLSYAKRVFAAYMARYATVRRLGRPVTNQDRARIWNGGPNGYKRNSTLSYWAKVKEQMNGR